jgi:hypothetical protein
VLNLTNMCCVCSDSDDDNRDDGGDGSTTSTTPSTSPTWSQDQPGFAMEYANTREDLSELSHFSNTELLVKFAGYPMPTSLCMQNETKPSKRFENTLVSLTGCLWH